MPVLNRIADIAPQAAEWRRDLHRNPELMFEVHRTASVVAERLRGFGLDEVVTGIGRTGVVGVLRGKSPGRAIGLRADMDALPIEEITGAEWSSQVPGIMHACGHDGHTAMLLAAARHLSETRNFAGTVVFVFQPAEEGGGGALKMIEDGLFERFPVDEIYGLHNMPGLPIGHFAIRSGAIMASTDRIAIEITGRGGHAARPQETIDPILVGAHIVSAVQSIVGRNVDPIASAVVSITTFHAGTAENVIPQSATLTGTVRALDPAVRDQLEARLHGVVQAAGEMFGARTKLTYVRGYPVTLNDADATGFAAAAARTVAGESRVDADTVPMMGAEDFSYYLERRPGAFIFMGNGPSAGLHHPAYDFNDDAIVHGASWWVRLVEDRLGAG
ncbi:M20 aminoacylase family protein [Oryzibacter oryziterrae]|uniref:M20 aminoacylase family protein n=1 Tax=Oryzibacter oryziterrae TaxID=2766474 RepID=UPI001F15D046|nr:M20 aminoacylase family protein [Oryzibacter oryziterrae]